MINISKLSSIYTVRRLSESDAGSILEICRGNTLFYQYCKAEPTKEQILSDLHITPPGIEAKDKYYIGFYQGDILVAVMDLIDGYPEKEIAFIGFFMMNQQLQGKNIGSTIIREVSAYLKSLGKTAIQLGIDKGNPQSSHFWKKNGFCFIREIPQDGWTVIFAEKAL